MIQDGTRSAKDKLERRIGERPTMIGTWKEAEAAARGSPILVG